MKRTNSHRYDDVDFVGQRNGKLQVIQKSNRGRTWLVCKCDCGNVLELQAHRFLEYKSCGCLEERNRKDFANRTKTHGMSESRLYSVWSGIKCRCYNPKYKHFDRYGGRGISVCDEWRTSFDAFRSWAYANGYDPNLTGKEQSIDRIDLDGNYCPENCRWANQKEQVRNRKNAVSLVYMGETMNPYEFAKITGITNTAFIYRRLKKGHSPTKIFEDWKATHEE